MTEQSGPKDLVRWAVRAEEVGFDLAVSSDHFSPWLTEQGHAPYAWSVLGAVAQATERLELMTYVTCPTMRYHPAVVAQKAATLQLLSDGRFTLGLGSGESLNEHIVGEGWPGVVTRQEMLVEAIEIIRKLHSGELVTHHGDYFDVDSARVWDVPDILVPVAVAVSGDASIERLAPLADHMISVEPKPTSSRPGTARRAPSASAREHGPSVRSRSAGTPTRRRRSLGPTTSSAGSVVAGRSTPTCRRRPASRVPPSSCVPRTSPSRSPAAPTWTRSSSPCAPTGRPASPTSPSCRSAATPRSASSTRRPSRSWRSCAQRPAERVTAQQVGVSVRARVSRRSGRGCDG